MMAAREEQRRELSSDEESSRSGDLRRGPWTVEEDMLLVNYIAAHGEGRWNALARCAGLRRTGKSCRLRWLNYLRPDLRRGNITAQEQLLILELHSRWGNRWSKIAQHLPGRTDNEIKNYWRTRVQKHARQLNCDVNSQQFKDLMRYLWMPRLLERIGGGGGGGGAVTVGDDGSAGGVVDLSSSCGATAASSSSVSTDGMLPQQLVSPPPPPPPPTAAETSGNDDGCSYSYGNNDDSTTTANLWDYQPTTTTTTATAQQQVVAGAAAEWSDESLLAVPGFSSSGVYADDTVGMAGLLPPYLGDTTTMWGAGADDLWYTQILMGL